jgi:hypothetical protein
MQLIRARADDWRPNNPRISVGGWIVAIIVVAALYVLAAAAIGHFVNGNGAPFLS